MTNSRKSDSDRPPAAKRQSEEREASGVVETQAPQQRAHVRVKTCLEVRVSTLDAHEDGPHGERYFLVASASTLDIGDGGMGLVAESELKRGHRVVVEVDLDDGETIERNGRIAWCYRDRLGQHRIGIRFEQAFPGLAKRVPKPD